jgi:hypothetical protein
MAAQAAATRLACGAHVFHSTCGDHITTYYKNRAAVYESTQRFVIAVASVMILTSAIALGCRMLHAASHGPPGANARTSQVPSQPGM